MNTDPIEPLDEAECETLDAFLAERIYEFNVQATGHADAQLLGGCVRNEAGDIIAGFNGHTWGGCCQLTHLWIHADHRGAGLGKRLLQRLEAEALRRGCFQVVLLTHSFQAPGFYEANGYTRKYAIENLPAGFSDLVYVKLLAGTR